MYYPFDDKPDFSRKQFRREFVCDYKHNFSSVIVELRSGRGSFSFQLYGKIKHVGQLQERMMYEDEYTRRFWSDDSLSMLRELPGDSEKLKNCLATKVNYMRGNSMVKVLFLSANPKDTDRLRLDEEVRSIDQALLQAEFRDKFDLTQHWAVRVSDLQACLLRHKPDIVHFSGHGSQLSEIIVEDNSGNGVPISMDALSKLFAVLKDNIPDSKQFCGNLHKAPRCSNSEV